MLDFGIEQGNIYYTANPATAIGGTGSDLLKSVNNTFNMHHIIASFPIWKSSAFKVGIVPYSNVGYKFVTTESNDEMVAEAGDIKYSKIGQGSIYRTFRSGATFWDRLSVGADLQFYFGTINRYSSPFTTNTSFDRSIQVGPSFHVQYRESSTSVQATAGRQHIGYYRSYIRFGHYIQRERTYATPTDIGSGRIRFSTATLLLKQY